jgi:hypothetical protein
MPFGPASGNNGSGPYSASRTLQRIVVLGYILAVAVPPLGFAIGLVLTVPSRSRSKHGAWIMLVSLAAAAIWALLISAGALKDTSQGY